MGKGEVHTGFRLVNLTDRGLLEDPGVDVNAVMNLRIP